MTSAPDGLPGRVGTQPADEVLRAAGMDITEAGKARWRDVLSRPIPEDALAEGRRLREQAQARAAGHAA